MTIVTLRDFQQFARPRIEDGLSNPPCFGAKLQEIFDFVAANESGMDVEANAYFDDFLKTLSDLFERGLGNIADGPYKRKMLRLLALSRSKHHSAEKLFDGLGSPLRKEFPVAKVAKPLFIATVQSMLDLLFDSTKQAQHGIAQFAMLSLLYWVVDELNVGFYLAERKYATQAYAHVRTVYDLLERVELFMKQPQWAEVWAGNDKQRILKELSPSGIRKKLGKPKFDAAYSFFSEVGTHGTFEAIRRRSAKRNSESSRPEVNIGLAGVPWDSEVVTSISSCIIAATCALIICVAALEHRLNPEEALQILQIRSDEAAEFLQEHFTTSLQDLGIDVSEFASTLKGRPGVPHTRPAVEM